MANANLFAQYLRPPKSVNEYVAEMDEADLRREQLAGAKRQNALQALVAQDTMDQRRIAGEDRGRLRDLAGQSGGDTNKLISLLRGSGSAGLMSQADTLEKGYLDRQKTEAEVGEKSAKTTREHGATLDDAMKRYRGALDFIDTPQGAARWMQAQYADPVLSPHLQRMGSIEQALQQIPTDPQAFQQWRQQAGMGMEKFLEQQQKGKDYQLKAGNELIGPDGKPNQALIGAKQGIAKAGASSVSVNTDSLGLKPKDRFEMEGKLADDYKGVTKTDAGVLNAVGKITAALAQPGAIKDQAAIYSFAKMLDPDGAVREADYAAVANTAGLLDRVRNYVQRMMTGEMLTDTQRAEMRQLAGAFEQVAQQRIEAAQADFAAQAGRYNLRPDSVFSGSKGAAQQSAPRPGKVVNFADLK